MQCIPQVETTLNEGRHTYLHAGKRIHGQTYLHAHTHSKAPGRTVDMHMHRHKNVRTYT